MVVDRLRTDLLNKLINARIDLAAYLQLRKRRGICQSAKVTLCVTIFLN